MRRLMARTGLASPDSVFPENWATFENTGIIKHDKTWTRNPKSSASTNSATRAYQYCCGFTATWSVWWGACATYTARKRLSPWERLSSFCHLLLLVSAWSFQGLKATTQFAPLTLCDLNHPHSACCNNSTKAGWIWNKNENRTGRTKWVYTHLRHIFCVFHQ